MGTSATPTPTTLDQALTQLATDEANYNSAQSKVTNDQTQIAAMEATLTTDTAAVQPFATQYSTSIGSAITILQGIQAGLPTATAPAPTAN